MSSPYSNIVRGKLSLKGAALPEKGKKKKKKSKRKAEEISKAPSIDEIRNGEDVEKELGNYSDNNSKPQKKPNNDNKTEYERRYEEKMRKREEQEIKKMAAKTYRERLDEFNQYVSKLSEHHDIPKVGPG